MDERISKYFKLSKERWLLLMFSTAYGYLEQALVYYDANDDKRKPHVDYEMIRTLTRAPGGIFWSWWREVFLQVDEKILASYESNKHIWEKYSLQRLQREYELIHTQINYLPPEGLIQKCKTQSHEPKYATHE